MNIRLVEIELTSFCNRQCKFCPNSFIDRHTNNIEMKDELFDKLINELVLLNYSGYISFSRYNEPFAYPEILRKRVNQIKEKLPNVTMVSNSNGDYSNKEFRDDIEITEMDYSNNKKNYVSEDKRFRVMRLGKLNNRAGSVEIKSELRKQPCFEPTYFVGVDYTGDIVSCCNIRSDIHKNLILGNIKDGLMNALNSDKAVKFRNDVKNCRFPEPCKYCNKEEGRYTREKGGII